MSDALLQEDQRVPHHSREGTLGGHHPATPRPAISHQDRLSGLLRQLRTTLLQVSASVSSFDTAARTTCSRRLRDRTAIPSRVQQPRRRLTVRPPGDQNQPPDDRPLLHHPLCQQWRVSPPARCASVAADKAEVRTRTYLPRPKFPSMNR